MNRRVEIVLLSLILLLATVLRFYQISNVPRGLYIDEMSIGYNAYSVLKTGHDEHGAKLPIWFKSFGDYKLPVYIYSTVASMAVFGKNDFSVRFTSGLSGVLTVFSFYLLLKNLVKDKRSKYLPLLGALILAVTPWSLNLSREGFEATEALAFLTAGLATFYYYLEKKKLFLLCVSLILLVLTVYTYNFYRLFIPIVLILGFIHYYKKISRNHLLIGVAIIAVTFLPVFLFSFTDAGNARFAQTSTFSSLSGVPLLQKLILGPAIFIKNYLSFFSLNFLFDSGDGFARHQPMGWGVLYRWQIVFLVIGLIAIIKNSRDSLGKLVLTLLFVIPVVGALTLPSPHSLRGFVLVLPLVILVSLGIYNLPNILKNKIILLALLLFVLFDSFSYLDYYFVNYPKVNINDLGAHEIAQAINRHKNEFDYIVVDSNLPIYPIYFKFYDDINPIYVGQTWVKPSEWKNKKVLFVRPYYGETSDLKVVEKVRLDTPSKEKVADIFAL